MLLRIYLIDRVKDAPTLAFRVLYYPQQLPDLVSVQIYNHFADRFRKFRLVTNDFFHLGVGQVQQHFSLLKFFQTSEFYNIIFEVI